MHVLVVLVVAVEVQLLLTILVWMVSNDFLSGKMLRTVFEISRRQLYRLQMKNTHHMGRNVSNHLTGVYYPSNLF